MRIVDEQPSNIETMGRILLDLDIFVGSIYFGEILRFLFISGSGFSERSDSVIIQKTGSNLWSEHQYPDQKAH